MMSSTFSKIFIVLTILFLPLSIRSECYPENLHQQTSGKKHCACVEKYGYCSCPQGKCACVEKDGHCDCQKTYKETFQKPCACVEKFGSCNCPRGVCACVEKNQQCPCQPVLEETSICDAQFQNCEVPVHCDDILECQEACLIKPLPQHQFYIGPEFYHVDRSKAGKYERYKQHGFIYGGRLGYDRIKRCRIYWGFDALYATGDLKSRGHSKNIKLRFTDENIEGRIGYTLQMKSGWLPTFVPYVGYGYYRETNKFKRPSPLLIKQRICFDYFALGFLSQIYPNPQWVLGLNFKARFLFNSKCKISDDPEYEGICQNIKHNVQYRVEAPITYRLNCWCDRLAIAVVPFYEFRHYGEHANFPFDFKDTRLNFYGFDVRFMYMF